jgi:uncharacterized integral membrane protein (TIGR00698 family)
LDRLNAVAHLLFMTLMLHSSADLQPAPPKAGVKALDPRHLLALLPGVGLCIAVTAIATVLQGLESKLFGRPWLEALVLAILIGAAIRTIWSPRVWWTAGIDFSAKTLLEVAVVLLGAGISARALAAAGPALLIGIAVVVVLAIAASYGIGRLFGLPQRMATLIACGNSICGNSAIAAVAPVIGAEGRDVAAAIGFTAVLGVAVVLGLPFLSLALHMSPRAFGVFAGLTVYAVPQVLAATAPISTVSAQIGALVKLVRVLMLGPVVLVLSLIMSRAAPAADGAPRAKLNVGKLVPWFIIGFLVLMGLRSLGAIPVAALKPTSDAATWLTVISMAALGLGVDVRVVAKAGPRAISVVTLSLVVLGAIAFGLIALAGVR